MVHVHFFSTCITLFIFLNFTIGGTKHAHKELKKEENNIISKLISNVLGFQDGSNAKLTNLFKLAVLPYETFNLAEEVIFKYNNNQLVPPASSHQRQREKLTSSSFSFLKGLNPLKEEDEEVINDLLGKWLETRIRPDGSWETCYFSNIVFLTFTICSKSRLLYACNSHKKLN